MNAILMTTYNGQTYLREQLDSLFSQTCQDWELYVSDDGSTDQTIAILEEYAHSHPNMHVEVNTKNLGPARNFMRMVEKVDADAYMFCDQDDVWLKDKVYQSLYALNKEDQSLPVVVCSDAIVVDEKLDVVSQSFFKSSGFIVEKSKTAKEFAVHSYVQGASMCFNRKAKEVSFPVGKNMVMHDYWISIRTLYGNGKIVLLKEQNLLYRQHGTNTLGAEEKLPGLQFYWYKITHFRKIYNVYKVIYLQAKDAIGMNLPEYIYYKFKYVLG